MAAPNRSQRAFSQTEALGWPRDAKVVTPFPFGSMNQQDSRSGMPDNEFYWLENYINIGKGYLRTIWDNGAPIYTAPGGKTIISFFFFNIGPTQYAIAFLSDGTADQVNISTLAVTHVSSTAKTFYVSGAPLPACCQSGSQYLLISTNFTNNGYWIWDGKVLYSAGSIGPQVTITNGGSGYSSIPSVTAYGGLGSGATFSAVVSAGSIVAVNVTNPGSGYEVGDEVQLQFSGGGSDTSAELTAVLTGTTVSHISLTSVGSGYTSPPTVSITGGGGSGATATATILNGSIVGLSVTAAGSSYTSTPTVSFSGGGGSGASAVALLNQTSIASVTVTNGGTGYNSAPTLTVLGGGGSGATLTAMVSGGAISSVTVGAGGTGFIQTPAVVVASGVNNAAAATVDLMPYGVSGSSMETFNSRVWLFFPFQAPNANTAGEFNVSAPESLTDFSEADGGTIFTSSDRFLRQQYVAGRQSNGYLYPFGDSSVSVVSNVQSSGSPVVTTFNYQNTDPQVGVSWRDSMQDFGRSILFANPLGVYGLYGGSVTKVSGKVDQLFQAAFPNGVVPPGAITPSSAVASIFKQKSYLILLTLVDPTVKQNRNVCLGWNERDWFVVSQGKSLSYIGTQEVNSNLTAWGTDGSTLFQLMAAPSSTLTKKLSSKRYGIGTPFMTKEAVAFYAIAQDLSSGQSGITMTGTIDTENGSYPFGGGGDENTIQLPQPLPPDGGGAMFGFNPGNIFGQTLGWTLTTTSPDFTIETMMLAYQDVGAYFG